MLVAQLDNI